VSQENSSPAVTLGLFDWVDADGVPEVGQLYHERLDLLADAEASPSVLLAVAAIRTHECPAVSLGLPLYHPARLVEEIAMLDQLSFGAQGDRVYRAVTLMSW
jgi:hypothetical protein